MKHYGDNLVTPELVDTAVEQLTKEFDEKLSEAKTMFAENAAYNGAQILALQKQVKFLRRSIGWSLVAIIAIIGFITTVTVIHH